MSETVNIVIVEDLKDIQEILRISLERQGYSIHLANNGREGLQLIKKIRPDLVISDVMMPKMDGYELLGSIRKDEEIGLTPVLLLTAKGALESRLKGLEIGADHYLVKPFRTEELLLKVRNTINTRRQVISKTLTSPSKLRNNSQKDQFLLKLRTCMDENLADPKYSVKDLATSVAVSQSTLHKKLKASTGQSASQYIREYRLKKGKELLLSDHANVSEVARLVGFNSLSYFSKCFKAFFDVSPSETLK